MSADDRLVRVPLEVTCRVRGELDDGRLATHLAKQLTRHAFNLDGAVVCPTAASTPARVASPQRTHRRRPPTLPPALGRGAPR